MHPNSLNHLLQLLLLPHLLHALRPSSQIIRNLIMRQRTGIPPIRLRTKLISTIMQPAPQTGQIARHLHRGAQTNTQTGILSQLFVSVDGDAGEPGQQAGEVEVGDCRADGAGGVDYRQDFAADLAVRAEEAVRAVPVGGVGGEDVDDYVFEDEVVDFDA